MHGYAVMIYSSKGADDMHANKLRDYIPNLRFG